MEEGARGSFGWRVLAVGALFFLATGLALMSFVILPQVPVAPFGGVTRIALSTAEGVRDNTIVVGAAFLILGAATGFGYADKLLKPIAVGAGAVLGFFIIAAWWTIRTVPAAGLIDLR